MIDRIKSLPNTLFVMFFVFLAIPLWSLSFADLPWSEASAESPELAALRAFTYWIGPLALAVTLLTRHFLFLPAFAVECAALLCVLTFSDAAEDGNVRVLRYSALGLSALLGFVFADKDLLMPFLTNRLRTWRRAPRLPGNARLTLLRDGSDEAKGASGEGVIAVMDDCSVSGLSASCATPAARGYLDGKQRGDPIYLQFRYKGEVGDIVGALIWQRADQDFVRFGISVDNEVAMRVLVDASEAGGGRSFVARMRRAWAKSIARRVAVAIWLASMATSFGVPACGKVKPEKKRVVDTTALER